ncbi:DapH/DapD/GlmU-related protein [Tateyamaria armeniaca]|uniref:Chloramphenicol acetyltransferase n=1 Tax=Tateyamaria armeniaca TaxID=2518930 RepID=A0ABW8UUF2_9RHOB
MAYLSEDDLARMGFAALGQNVRISEKASIYEPKKMRLGDHTRIDDFCVISGRVTMGRNVHVAALCLVAGGSPGVTLDDFAGMAYGAKVFSQSDDYSGASLTNPTVPDGFKTEHMAAVRLGRHVIIGANAVVGPGVDLGDGSAVGAGSVVLHSTEPWTIVAGTPAKRIKTRKKDLLDLERKYLDQQES